MQAIEAQLSWPGKGANSVVSPARLVEEPAFAHGDHRDNRILHGDNLPALATLAADMAGQIQCIYIDPPYATGACYDHYDDAADLSGWLDMMHPRLMLLHRLLAADGVLFVQIDGRQLGYLKVMLDEVFGRRNWLNDIVWKRRGGSANPSSRLNNVTDFIVCYGKSEQSALRPVYSRHDAHTRAYIACRFRHVHEGRRFMLAPVERNKALGDRPPLRYEYRGYTPRHGWMMKREKLEELDAAGRLHWNSKGRPNRRVFLDDYAGQPVGNLWTDIKVINPMSRERLAFDGQKPEALLRRLLQLCTKPGDLVLDAFAGSGTTAAVAHKMKRRWIAVEQSLACREVLLPRLVRVVEGADSAGITQAEGWSGGGGFRFFRVEQGIDCHTRQGGRTRGCRGHRSRESERGDPQQT
jgi:adenine-specific DNA-methyltransferase